MTTHSSFAATAATAAVAVTAPEAIVPAPLGRAEARRLCQAALVGAPARERSLLVEIDARGAHVIVAAGAEPIALWTLSIAAAADEPAITAALTRARLGFLRGWFVRRAIVLASPPAVAKVFAQAHAARRRARVLRALAAFLGLPDLAELGHAARAVPRAA
jgi:hypothetical protein